MQWYSCVFWVAANRSRKRQSRLESYAEDEEGQTADSGSLLAAALIDPDMASPMHQRQRTSG